MSISASKANILTLGLLSAVWVSLSSPAVTAEMTVAPKNPPLTAAMLTAHAQQQGTIRVIVGLNLKLQPDEALTKPQTDAQMQRLLNIQQLVALRILGRSAGDDIVKFPDIPYLSMFVNAEQLSRLLVDPDVVSVAEDTPRP